MRAGRARYYVKLQSVSQTTTNAGGYTETWTTYANVWIDIMPQRGMEFDRAGQMVAKLPHKIRMRYPGREVNPNDRILWGDRVLNIISVSDIDERKKDLELFCMEEDT